MREKKKNIASWVLWNRSTTSGRRAQRSCAPERSEKRSMHRVRRKSGERERSGERTFQKTLKRERSVERRAG